MSVMVWSTIPVSHANRAPRLGGSRHAVRYFGAPRPLVERFKRPQAHWHKIPVKVSCQLPL